MLIIQPLPHFGKLAFLGPNKALLFLKWADTLCMIKKSEGQVILFPEIISGSGGAEHCCGDQFEGFED
jgi:hypothetical protein